VSDRYFLSLSCARGSDGQVAKTTFSLPRSPSFPTCADPSKFGIQLKTKTKNLSPCVNKGGKMVVEGKDIFWYKEDIFQNTNEEASGQNTRVIVLDVG